MSKRALTAPTPTTESGAPVADNQNSASAGIGGPRLPARGSGAYGCFEVTDDVTGFTHGDSLSAVGKRTQLLLRSSTVSDSLGGADAVRED
jgi:catalase